MNAPVLNVDAPSAVAETEAFLRQIFGSHAAGHLVICTARPGNDRRTPLSPTWFQATDFEGAAAFAAAQSAHRQVFFAVGLQREQLPAPQRGGSKSVGAIPGVWSEIDVLHTVHQKTALPPTVEEALDLVDKVGIVPTFIIDTGHGIQCYWLFASLWVFADEADREAGQQLCNAFKAAVAKLARDKGWQVDAVADLARVLRPAGTVNRKEPENPLPVRFLIHNPDCRYTIDDIRAAIERLDTGSIAAPEPSLPKAITARAAAAADDGLAGIEFLHDDNLLVEQARGAENGAKFGRLWDGDDSMHDGDTSAADLALCESWRSGPGRTLRRWTGCSVDRSGGGTNEIRPTAPTAARTGR